MRQSVSDAPSRDSINPINGNESMATALRFWERKNGCPVAHKCGIEDDMKLTRRAPGRRGMLWSWELTGEDLSRQMPEEYCDEQFRGIGRTRWPSPKVGVGKDGSFGRVFLRAWKNCRMPGGGSRLEKTLVLLPWAVHASGIEHERLTRQHRSDRMLVGAPLAEACVCLYGLGSRQERSQTPVSVESSPSKLLDDFGTATSALPQRVSGGPPGLSKSQSLDFLRRPSGFMTLLSWDRCLSRLGLRTLTSSFVSSFQLRAR